MSAHDKSKGDLVIKCDLCGKNFKTTQGLAGHRGIVHPDYAPVETAVIVECIDKLSKSLAQVADNQLKVSQVLERQERQLNQVIQALSGEVIRGQKLS